MKLLKNKLNGYDVVLENNILKCNNADLSIEKFNKIINAYIVFTEFYFVEDNNIVINKDNTGKELFHMIIPFSELKAIYKELRYKPIILK